MVGVGHAFRVKRSPEYEAAYECPLVVPDLLGAHGLELLGVVEVFLLLGVVNEVGVVGVPVGEEVEGFVFQPYEHPI